VNLLRTFREGHVCTDVTAVVLYYLAYVCTEKDAVQQSNALCAKAGT
jgi:hypothetical protein